LIQVPNQTVKSKNVRRHFQRSHAFNKNSKIQTAKKGQCIKKITIIRKRRL
jgi:hypothetical protein